MLDLWAYDYFTISVRFLLTTLLVMIILVIESS